MKNTIPVGFMSCCRENDYLMYMKAIAEKTSKKRSPDEHYVIIYLKREGESRQGISMPLLFDNPHFTESWELDEIFDLMWNEKTVTYTTKLNEDYEQVEA